MYNNKKTRFIIDTVNPLSYTQTLLNHWSVTMDKCHCVLRISPAVTPTYPAPHLVWWAYTTKNMLPGMASTRKMGISLGLMKRTPFVDRWDSQEHIQGLP